MKYLSKKVERTTASYADQLTTPDVKTVPMRKGLAVGGPLHKIKIEAALTWDGRMVKWIILKDKSRKASGYLKGHYIWTGTRWRWLDDGPDEE